MIEDTAIRQKLDLIIVPAAKRSVVGLNLVKNIDINSDGVRVTLASTALMPKIQDWIKHAVEQSIRELDGSGAVNVEFVNAKPGELNNIQSIIAVMSGKGGVGKSLVSGLLAVALKRQGYSVGILDGDITGPSIPRMFGIKLPPTGNESGILPVPSRTGISVMSVNLILSAEDEAVIWRGPMIANAIKQFRDDVVWGNLDYLIVDLPPGTADAPLTVMQSFPVSGVIIVFTPQDLVDMIVKKALNMAEKLGKKVVGVVENMSYLYVPEIDKRIEIFGKSRGEQMSKTAKAPLIGRIPIDPELAKVCDEGNLENYDGVIIRELGENLKGVITK